ncbi:phage holin family protein [Salmonella enterica subsp. enterica]|nr:phage holin family protein [Salmonella enterica subsp. enterica serovar Virchow]
MILRILPVVTNVVLCTLIIVRIISFRRNNCRYKPAISWLAWLLTVSCGIVIFALLSGFYKLADWAEIIINCLFCISLYLSSGNIANILKSKG